MSDGVSLVVDPVTEAIIHKQTWKTAVMDGYARAFLKAGMDLYRFRRVRFFNNDDVPSECQPCDKTTVGCVVNLLIREGLIEPYRESHPEKEIWGGMRRSTRKENHGHRNQLYRIKSWGLVETWMARHGGDPDPVQPSLF